MLSLVQIQHSPTPSPSISPQNGNSFPGRTVFVCVGTLISSPNNSSGFLSGPTLSAKNPRSISTSAHQSTILDPCKNSSKNFSRSSSPPKLPTSNAGIKPLSHSSPKSTTDLIPQFAFRSTPKKQTANLNPQNPTQKCSSPSFTGGVFPP